MLGDRLLRPSGRSVRDLTVIKLEYIPVRRNAASLPAKRYATFRTRQRGQQ
jgi:hypothetical protein